MPLNLRLAFNALGPVQGEWMAVFQVEDVTQGVWVVDPIAVWVPFVPAFLLVGLSPVGGMSGMNGTVQHVQVSGFAEIAYRAVPPTEEENAVVEVTADSALVGDFTGTRQLDSAVTTDSVVAAEMSFVFAGDAAMTADSDVGAEMDVIPP